LHPGGDGTFVGGIEQCLGFLPLTKLVLDFPQCLKRGADF